MASGKTRSVEAARYLPAGTFEGRVAVVTGGGTGLGLQISRGLAELGATVVIASRSADHHGSFLDEGRRQGWAVDAVTLDVREPGEVDRAAASIVSKHGPVDILVNNAAGNFVCPAERLSTNAWRSVLGIVLDGTFFCSRAFGRGMLTAGGGQIFNVLATYVYTGMPGVVHSASAKAGVLAMTKTLAAEWAEQGIRVNAIAPGPFETEGAGSRLWPDEELRQRILADIPLGRFATADEVAGEILHLLSPACAYMTGECVVLDGGALLGRSMWPKGRAVRRDKSKGGESGEASS